MAVVSKKSFCFSHCPHDLLSITVKGLAAMRVPSLSLPRPCAITQFQTETFWRNRLSPERLRESIQYLAIAKSLDYSFAIFLSWYLKNKVPPIAISKTDPTTINVFIFFCFLLFLLSYLHLPSTARILRL